MEGKSRGAAAWCLVIMFLVCGQHQQVDALTTFCRCYKDCYSRSRDRSKSLCGFVCFTTCPLTPQPPAHDCAGICRSLSVCGVAAIEEGPDDTKACVDACASNSRAHAPTTALLN